MSAKKELKIRHYVVCLVDVLGQREKLRQWADVTPGKHNLTQAIQAIHGTAGTILNLQEFYKTFFEGIGRCTIPSQIAALSPQQQEIYARAKSCDLRTQQFADTFVFYCPIRNVYSDVSVIPTYHMIGACCVSMVEALANRTALRGAITIGQAVELEDRIVYGPALVEAHTLESNVARYPRVVVSPSVREFIAGVYNYSSEPKITESMKSMAKVCQSLTWQDVDGYWAVDFLGRGSWDVLKDVQGLRERVERAYGFVRSEAERFRDERNSKLAFRYHLLRQYMESRAHIWGVNPAGAQS